jgi:hypothetical protein
MYSARQVIAFQNHNEWKIIAVCTVAMMFNYGWFFAALRVARRDRRYSVPVFCTMFWLVGDSSFLWHFHTWFNTYKNWYTELFWVALIFTCLFEVAFTIQLIQYGRDELAPGWTQRQFAALVLGGVGVAIVWWSLVRHVLNDPLWIIYFDFANFVGPFFGAALVLRRKTRAGQTPMIWWCYAAMSACWYIAQGFWFGPSFQSDEYSFLAAFCVVAAAGLAYVLSRMPAYVTAPAPEAGRSQTAAAVPASGTASASGPASGPSSALGGIATAAK